jgi:hypothetical protein
MATVYEIVQGLSQAAANAYDGALDESGDPLKAGLQREEGDAILDKRVMDGFNVKFYGNMMCLSYQAEVQLKEVYANGFEQEVEQRIADIASFLKKEYKKVTGESVTLTTEGELDVDVQSTSRVRNWVQAKMHYKVGGLEKEMNNENTDNKPPTAYWQDFMSQGGWTGDGGKRPQNDTRKKES